MNKCESCERDMGDEPSRADDANICKRCGDALLKEQPEVSDHQVLDAMQKYGGGFVHALSIAARYADRRNLHIIIKTSWPDYWIVYEDMARKDIKSGRVLDLDKDPEIIG